MKNFFSVLMLSLLIVAAHAQTDIGGTISVNTTYGADGSPYTVTSGLTVNAGVTLTIETGVTLRFNDNLGLTVNGTLSADGVTFTSNNGSPTAGIWPGIDLRGANTHSIINSQILYGREAIDINNGSLLLDNTSISNSQYYGLYATSNTAEVDISISADNLTVGGSRTGIYIPNRTTLALTNSNVSGSSDQGIYYNELRSGETATSSLSLTSTTVSDGSTSALYLGNGNVTLTDVTLTTATFPIRFGGEADVTYAGSNSFTGNDYDVIYMHDLATIDQDLMLANSGIPYYFSNSTVANGAHLSIASENVLKFAPNRGLTIKGKFTADAAIDEKIDFTTWYDDNTGGDSNADGNTTSPSTGKWYGITFDPESDDTSSIVRAEIRWTRSRGAITTSHASPTIDNCNISNAYYGAEFRGASAPIFTNNVIGGSDRTPVAMSFDANPTFTDNAFSTADNEYDGIGLLGGEISQDAQIIQRDFTDLPNVTYVMLSAVTVPEGLSLTIDPGVVIKTSSTHDFIIHGTLDMQGTVEDPIVITSIHDDNYGNPGDTRNDGTDQIPALGNVGGIYFSGSSTGSIIDYGIVKFANYNERYQYETVSIPSGNYYYDNYYAAAIAIDGSEPSITNTTISDATYGIDFKGATSAVIHNNEFINTTYSPLRLSINSTPNFNGNVFNSVGWKAVGILPEVINNTATLTKRNIAGLDNITYVLNGLVVNDGATLNVAEGLILKSARSKYIEIFGTLKMIGTSDEPIVITSIADDNEGASTDLLDNDTQDNGNATDPSSETWHGIRFWPSSDDENSQISYTKMKYGNSFVRWDNAGASVDHLELLYSNGYGMWMIGDSNPVIDNVLIQNAKSDPLAMSVYSDPTFTNITFDGNGSNGIKLLDTTLGADAQLSKRDVAGINNIAYVTEGFTVNSGATFTIDPGVVIKFTVYYYGLTIGEGAIVAIGTAEEPIIFTSIRDDSRGGDTNIDGNESVPDKGNWGGLQFAESTMQSHLQHCQIRYSGSATGGTYEYGTITSTNNNLLVEDCVFQLVAGYGFGVYGTSSATFRNNKLENVTNTPVVMDVFADPTFEGNTLENVDNIRILLREQTLSQSATLPFRSFAGYDSISYSISLRSGTGLTVNSGTKITVPAGMVFKTRSGYPIFTVNGELHVAGETDNPVIFTDEKDDDFGNPKDTFQDGPPTSALGRGGVDIIFKNISDDNSVVENAVFRYSTTGYSIKTESASPTIQNNLFEYAWSGINSSGISEPHIINNTFKDLVYTPFATSLVAYPATTTGNVMEGSTYRAIRIFQETLTQDTTIVQKSFGGIDNIPYLMNGYTVGLGVKLTIDPGVIIKFTDDTKEYNYSGSRFLVRGALAANGEASTDGTIIFTSESDDFYGGDSNRDSTATAPNYNWLGIQFDNESSDSESVLDNVIIRYASYEGISLISASPTISNTTIMNCGYYSGSAGGLYMNGASNPILSNNDILDNRAYGIKNEGSFTVDATGTWWGDNSGPYHATLNTEGKGDEVVGDVTFDPWADMDAQNPLTGDVSLNGYVTAFDAALTLQDVAGITTFSALQDRAGDVSGDGSVSAMDASYVLQYAAGLIQSFPAESTNKRSTEQFANPYSEAVIAFGDVQLENDMEAFSVPVTISDVQALFALSMELSLDPTFDFVSFEMNKELAISPTINFDEFNRHFTLAFGGMNGITEDFVLGQLNLKLNTTSIHNPAIALDASKIVSNETDVTARSKAANIELSRLVTSVALADEYNIYPNPARDHLTIRLPKHATGEAKLSIINISGQEVHAQKLGAETISLNFKPGVYSLKIKSDSGIVQKRLIIVQ